MEDNLFSSILYLIPLALFIFFRVMGGGKKTQAAKERRAKENAARQELARRVQAELKASGRAVPLSRISGREPEVQDWEPHWVTESDADLADAAGTQPVFEVRDEEGPEPSQRLTFLETETDLRTSEAPAGSLADFAPSLAARPGSSSQAADVGRFDQYPISGSGPSLLSPADISDAQAAADARAASRPLPGTVEKLPPMKRAVVLAEILGPPKGA